MEQERIYGVAAFETIVKTNVDAHIKEFETFEEASSFPKISFIVIKKRQNSENIPGTGLFFPNVFTYKIVNFNKQHYFIEYGKCKAFDTIIKTKRLGYNDSIGSGEVSIYDKNKELDTVELKAEYDDSIGIVANLIEFLIDFENNYNSDWKLYRIKTDLSEKIKNLEEQLANADLKVSDMAKKIKELNRLLRLCRSSKL